MTYNYEMTQPNDYQWTEKAFEELVAGRLNASITNTGGLRSIDVTGPCPRCGDDVNYSQVLAAIGGEVVGVLGGNDLTTHDYLSLPVPCRCTGAHDGRPEGVDQGCGINFTIEVRNS